MYQATHLPIAIVSHIKDYENDNIFLEKILIHVEFFKYCKKNARYPSALVQYYLSIVFIHSVYQIVFIHYA